jgi:hypothetical protein
MVLLTLTRVLATGNPHTPVVICHKGQTMTIPAGLVPGYLQHGDTVGACATEEPTSVVTDEPTTVVTEEPTTVVTDEPTVDPTEEPTTIVTEEPTYEPTVRPTKPPHVTPVTVTPEPFRALPVCEAWSVLGEEFQWEIFLNGTWFLLTQPDGTPIVTPVEYADRWNDVIGAIEPHVAFTRLVITPNMPEDATLYRTTTQSERWVECRDGVHSVDQR